MRNHRQVIEQYSYILEEEPSIYFSPGRVNLIGEHIDYLGGHVFPSAINLGIYGYVTKRQDNLLRLYSLNQTAQGLIEVSIDALHYDEMHGWANYAIGMVAALKERVQLKHGFNIVINGNLPNGAGLSSSASLEVLIGTIVYEELKHEYDMKNLVQIAQSVENNFIGVNCGIMDQFAVGMGKQDHAIFLNTNTLEYDLVPLKLREYTLVISNTNKRRSLTESKYNERREQCDKGLKRLQKKGIKINQLCELSDADYHTIKGYLYDTKIRKRVRHAISENERTKESVKALKNNDLKMFGRLMNESHNSLRDDFEVSCKELDVMVDSFRKHGAIGSRMTGAGFGGCTISLVKTEHLEDTLDAVSKDYIKKTTILVDHYPVLTSDGTHRINEEEQR